MGMNGIKSRLEGSSPRYFYGKLHPALLWKPSRRFVSLAALCILCLGCNGGDKDPTDTDLGITTTELDINPDPHIFEANFTASTVLLDIGTDEPVNVLAYNGQIPGPEIRVVAGDRVIIHLTNNLPDDFPTTIHWHGIEGTNSMDGTPVTQAPIQPGATFTYDFVVPRSGVYWYHPHIRGAQTTFSGLYGALIVDDPDLADLIANGTLPLHQETLVLSDINVFGDLVLSVESDNAMVIMNGTEGKTLLVNGQVMPSFEVPVGAGMRLQLLNTSITRFYRLKIPGATMYRVGGENGLLESVRVEGGTVSATRTNLEDGSNMGNVDLSVGFERGEVLIGPAERIDVVIVPNGNPGDTLTLRWEDYARGRHDMWMEDDLMVMGDADDDGLRDGMDIATLQLVPGGGDYQIAEGDPILTTLGRTIEPIDMTGEVKDWTGENATELQGSMDMWEDETGNWQMATYFAIDGVSWHANPVDNGLSPEADSAKRANIGDTIRWEVRNDTMMAHPFHLHGFSFQPTRFEQVPEDEPTVQYAWDLDYREYEDTVLIPANTSAFLNVEIIDINGNGGAVGRWLKHCHIFQHGTGGMMSELIISP